MLRLIATAMLAAALTSCTLLAPLFSDDPVAQITAMSESEFIAWRNTAVEEVAIVAEAAYAEGAISADDINTTASVLAVIAGENAVEAGQLAQWIGASPAMAGLLKLAMLELNSSLVAGGAYVDGLLGARGKELLLALAARLAEIAPQ